MENLFEVQAELRTDAGKGASRRLRHAGSIPAIIYGDNKAPISLTLNHNVFLRHLQEDAFYAHILTVIVDGEKHQAVLKDLQRHPASDVRIMHADFLRISNDHALTMHIPVHFLNEELSPGVKAGGLVSHLMSDVEVTCLPKDLPEFIEVDVAAVELNGSIHLTEITLPEGVQLTALAHAEDEELAEGERSSYDQAIVSIHEPRVVSDEDEDETAATEDEEAATEE
ncbi:MAG: 50S ribosomal protein L25/general stress protein Ctc [Gammaproteobacteria bacterium]|nr:MAG: 50S ribosomal protein L25/general stress protein Ctc [Gammaproteobacteria bacterium]